MRAMSRIRITNGRNWISKSGLTRVAKTNETRLVIDSRNTKLGGYVFSGFGINLCHLKFSVLVVGYLSAAELMSG